MNENWFKGVRCTRLSGGSRECGSVSYGLRNQGACFAYWFFPSRWIICWYSWRSRPRHPAKIYCHLVNQTHRSVTIARVISTCSLHYFSPSSDRFVISTVNAEWIGKWMIYSLALHLSRLRKISVTIEWVFSRNVEAKRSPAKIAKKCRAAEEKRSIDRPVLLGDVGDVAIF